MQGRVRFFTPKKWGFISYSLNGDVREIFFHISQIQVAEDGVKYEPVAGCVVDFVISLRRGSREEAKFIRIVEWPSQGDSNADIEDYFLSVPELAPSVSEPTVPLLNPKRPSQPSVLAPATSRLTLKEIVLQRKLKKQIHLAYAS